MLPAGLTPGAYENRRLSAPGRTVFQHADYEIGGSGKPLRLADEIFDRCVLRVIGGALGR